MLTVTVRNIVTRSLQNERVTCWRGIKNISYKRIQYSTLQKPHSSIKLWPHPLRPHPSISHLYNVRYYSTPPTNEKGTTNDSEVTTKRQDNRNRLTRILREYGSVAVVFHTSMSLCVLGVCYMIVKSGVDVENFLKYFKIDSSRYSTASTFAVSYIIYKILLPIRATITVTCVPLIVRSLRARGWIKTPPQSVNNNNNK